LRELIGRRSVKLTERASEKYVPVCPIAYGAARINSIKSRQVLVRCAGST
jgi:hypothetical protein